MSRWLVYTDDSYKIGYNKKDELLYLPCNQDNLKTIKREKNNKRNYILPVVTNSQQIDYIDNLYILYNEKDSDIIYHDRYERQFLPKQNQEINNKFNDKYIEQNYQDRDDIASFIVLKRNIKGPINLYGKIYNTARIHLDINENITSINMPDFEGELEINFNEDRDTNLNALEIYCPHAKISFYGNWNNVSRKVQMSRLECSSFVSTNINILRIEEFQLNEKEERHSELRFRNPQFVKVNKFILNCKKAVECGWLNPHCIHLDNIVGNSNLLRGTPYCTYPINYIKDKTFIIGTKLDLNRVRNRQYLINYILKAGGKILTSASSADYFIFNYEDYDSAEYKKAIKNNCQLLNSHTIEFWIKDCLEK